MGWFEKKLHRIMRPVRIRSSFPAVALTVFDTIAGLMLKTTVDTLDKGYLHIGTMAPSSLEDCFYTCPAVEAGAIATSTINATGADNMMQVYKQYRIYEQELIIRWRNNTPQVSAEAAFTHPGYTTTGPDTGTSVPTHTIPAHDHVHFAQQTLCLVIIPSTVDDVLPASDWAEVMHHPFAIISKQRLGGVNNTWNTLKVPAINTMAFNKLLIQVKMNFFFL